MRGWLQVGGLSMLALGAGVSLLVQVVLNARLRIGLAAWSWAALVSYLGGTLAVAAILIVLRQPWPSEATRHAVPWWAWAGGLFGAIYLVLAIVSLPRLGAASTVALVVTGQMLASLAFDHFGLLGLDRQPASTSRFLGAALLVVSVVLMRR
ncbi:MAG TPA: DMT family transporter [Polyangiaceae bacterium]